MKKNARIMIPLAVLSLFAVFLMVKNIFVGMETDEQYPLILTYKLMEGKTMFRDCFEIHQTSTLITAAFLSLKRLLSGTTYDLIYLRICSLALYIASGTLVWNVTKNKIEKPFAFALALFFATFLPKFYLTMDYATLQYPLLTMMMCLFVKNDNISYTEWKNTDYILFGILSGLLTFAYPPFICYPILLIFCFKKQSWKVYVSALPTAILFLMARGGIDISSISNIFSDASHSGTLLSKITSDVKQSWQLLVIVLYMLFLLTTAKKEKEKQNIVTAFLVFAIVMTAICVFVKCHRMGYNGAWLLVIAIMLSYTKLPKKHILIFAIIPLMQFLSGNQTGFLFARYLIPLLLPMFISDKIPDTVKRRVLFTVFILSFLPICISTANFQNRQTYFAKIDTGPAKGIYTDQMTQEKIQEVSNFYKDKEGSFLLMDSSAILYTETPLSIHCPDTIDTPTFDDRFITYYKENGYPDYIYYVPGKNAVKLSDSFKAFIKENYDTVATLGYGYCLSRH